MTSRQTRQDEILAKRAKLAELKRQRELRQKEFTSSRQSIDATELSQPSPLRNRLTRDGDELDALVSSLVDRPSSTTPDSPVKGTSRRVSGVVDTVPSDAGPPATGTRSYQDAATDTQTLSFTNATALYEIQVESKSEIITYSKGVQTSEEWQTPLMSSDDEANGVNGSPSRRRRKLSKRGMELEEEAIRQRLRREIEEELKALQLDDKVQTEVERFPARTLAPDELNAVTGSADFLDFVDRSSKVIERALDEEYDVLVDYAVQARSVEDEDGDTYSGRRGRRIKEIKQFYLSDTMGSRRMLSHIDFNHKFPELFCASYTKSQQSSHTPAGLLNVWNLHLDSRPEYSLHASSDLLTCLFHPHHPSLILGGTYSGQLCLWDTRARHQRTGAPVQQTPLTGGRTGHAHPIYSLAVVGTQNASSVISVSTDGVVCAWTPEMLTQPQEYLELHSPNPSAYKTDDVAPTCISFPASDPTYFLAGTEQGSILPVHRYDRPGAKAGVDARCTYKGHEAPVMSIDFHPARGKMDLGDLFLSSGMDWSLKVWRAKPPSTTSSTISGQSETVTPLLSIQRDDAVYDAKWSPTRPGVFGCVDGAGSFDVYDINTSSEIAVASARPSHYERDMLYSRKSLNTLAWGKSTGRHVAVGGLDGAATVFELGNEISGLETKTDAWLGVKKWANRMGRSG